MKGYLLGAHLSISKGLDTLDKQMTLLGMDTCAFFLKNQRTYNFKELDQSKITSFLKTTKNPQLFLPHASYLINLASDDPTILNKSKILFEDDLKRCLDLNISNYNIHPGSNKNKQQGIKNLASQINDTFKRKEKVNVLIENTAGQGNIICSKFEEIKSVIDLIDEKDRVGVCLDTCHLFAAGYDIRTTESFNKVIESFDEIVGLKYLKALHLNDSKSELNSKVDRHEQIGKGKIGENAFKFIMQNEIFKNIPLILETPNPELYKTEIQLLKGFIKTSL